MNKVVLKKGRERSLKSYHPWVFSGAIASIELSENGAFAPVYSADGEMLGSGYFNRETSIAGRMVCFDNRDPKDALRDRIRKSSLIRRALINSTTNAYRLFNSEGDGIPGLIIDRYNDVLVVQSGTLGIERCLAEIVEFLVGEFEPRTIFEKSSSNSRQEEGLGPKQGLLWGEATEEVDFLENGLKFRTCLTNSQKTGFFLDQREMRALTGRFCSGRSVLNCFAYSGGFSVYALRGGARKVVSVDSSKSACEQASVNVELNFPECSYHQAVRADVFDYLRGDIGAYDLVILDPPAFVKQRNQVEQAIRGYRDINRAVLSKIPEDGILVTSSCSHFMTQEIFQRTIFEAARDAKRDVKILHAHSQASDHLISLYHPEGEYLKSLVLWVGSRI